MSQVKSDGGSSSYYECDVFSSMTNEYVKFEFGDYMRDGLNNQADLCNISKACHRIAAERQGRGKQGTSEMYDLRKIIWFAEQRLNYLNAITQSEGCNA